MLECRYKGQCRIEYDTDFDVCYPCIGDWGDTCARYEPMPDAESLLALAEEAKTCAWYFGLNHDNDELKDRLEEAAADFSNFARLIREACGEVER